ncbi:MAG TPA: hypothetical protein VF215_02915 [Thermoanaerobaculia bacterium]
MAQLSSSQYDALERAIVDRQRIAVMRRGTEYIVIPVSIGLRGGKETIEALHPTTGERLTLVIDDVEEIEVVK